MTFLKAAVFDWAGTVIDHGSQAPMGAFVAAFAQFGVTISIAQARGPMGLPKRDHIATLMALPEVAAGWRAAQGGEPGDAAIDRLLAVFEPLNIAAVADHAALIPGAIDTVTALRTRGLKIGSTTGYTRPIMERVLPLAAAQGYAPDSLVCAGDLPAGRPTPLMMYRTFLELGAWPAWSVVKVDDTAPGIAEGIAAGTWTVGVAMTGNAVGLTAAELSALPEEERAVLRHKAGAELLRAGAHVVVDSIADLLPVVDSIEGRLARGERP